MTMVISTPIGLVAVAVAGVGVSVVILVSIPSYHRIAKLSCGGR
jgi:hypothetical protein